MVVRAPHPTGQELDRVLLVRERELRRRTTAASGSGSCSATAAATVTARSCATATARRPCEHGAAGARAGPLRGRSRPRPGDRAIRRCAPRAPRRSTTPALLDGPPRDAAQMEADLRDLVATVQNPHLRALLDAVLGAGVRRRGRSSATRRPPSATTRPTATGCSSTRSRSPSRCRRSRRRSPGSTATSPSTGALLHDIGKLDAYTADPLAIDMTDLGKLQGEIPLGYYRVRRLIEDLPGLPGRPRRGGAAHHPQPPRRARARLAGGPVHARGDARAHDRQPRRPARLVRPAGEGSCRTARAGRGYDRALGGGAYFADREAA